jgi:16S rRNA (cytosine967-C5)-methyltransferase
LSPQPVTAAEGGRPGHGARAAAARLLGDVLDRGRSLDALLDEEGAGSLAELTPRDRALARAILGTALRRHGEIDAVLAGLIQRMPPRSGVLRRVLEIGAAQILFMDVPAYAAVSVAMEEITADRAAQRYRGLANAVLRRMAREREALTAGLDPLVNVPEWLRARWLATYGEDATRAIAVANRGEPSLDLSVKGDAAAWAARLGGVVLPTGTVRTVPSGPVEALPGYAEGAWWVQDAAAALPARLLAVRPGERVADLCAAPGGKTAALAAAGARVTAVDVSPARLKRVSETLDRLGLAAEVVAADVLAWEPGETFDAILLDAPCTATGTIRRHPDIPWLKRAADVAALAGIQARLLDKAVALLKPGGRLVYATCSLEPEEGEAQLARARQRHGLAVLAITAAEVGLDEAVTADGTVRTMPFHLANPNPRLAGLDGFFVTRLAKP